MSNRINIDEFVMALINKDIIRVAYTPDKEYLCAIKDDKTEKYKVYSLDETECRHIINSLYYREEGKYLTTNQIQKGVDILKAVAYSKPLEKPLANRIYSEGDDLIVYDLNEDTSVLIEPGNVEFCEVDEWTFRRDVGYKPQVEPDLMVEPCELFPLIKKHFNFVNDKEAKLFMLYLVLCFKGNVRKYILYLYGEKGASKSTSLKKLADLLNPHTGNIIGMPNTIKDLQLRLAHNDFLGIDNVSYISHKVSDLLCMSVTEAEIPLKKLYTTTEEVILDIACTVAITSTSLVFTKSDILDRTLVLKMRRLDSTEYKTDFEVLEEFNHDKPALLGAIFNTLAKAMEDYDDIAEGTKLVRMAHFHKEAVKVGHVLDMTDDEVTELLWYNQTKLNSELLLGDELSLCILQYFKTEKEFRGSVTDFLIELRKVADSMGIDWRLLPAKSNVLSRKLNEMQSNLAQFSNIKYKIVKHRTYKEIIIAKEG